MAIRPIPHRNEAFTVYFTIRDSQGNLVAGATGLDSERSLDGGSFLDCTNEAQNIGQGFYWLDLTAAEMNTSITMVIVKSTEGEPTAIFLYTEQAGDIRVTLSAVTHTGAVIPTVTAATLAAAVHTGATVPTVTDVTNAVTADVTQLSGNAPAATALRYGALGLVTGTIGVGSTSTVFETNLTEVTNDHYNGRVVTLVTGGLAGQSLAITDYDGTNKRLTVSAVTADAPANGDLFVIS